MAQQIYRPGEPLPAAKPVSEVEILEDSIESLRGKLNLASRITAHWKAGKNAANVLVEMQRDVAEAQRDVVQHHANLIARARKMDLTDRFQEGISSLTRRVSERTDVETRYYWDQLSKRLDYYEEFFQSRIDEIRAKVDKGEMSKERGAIRIAQYEKNRDDQQSQDQTLLNELMDANLRVVRRALSDYQPS